MATGTTYEHIVLDENGIPWIGGANTSAQEAASSRSATGSPTRPRRYANSSRSVRAAATSFEIFT